MLLVPRTPVAMCRILSKYLGCQIKTQVGIEIKRHFTSLRTFSDAAANPPPATYEFIKIEKVGNENTVAVITLNSPKSLNTVSYARMNEVDSVLDVLEDDTSINAIIITGSRKVFSAGGDVKEMLHWDYYSNNDVQFWYLLNRIRKPVIAAVDGFVVGGGCGWIMTCDIVYAGENAKFCLPEIALGTIASASGTQRLIRSVGKSKAMEMILTGNFITAQEAERMGLVSKVFPSEQLLPETIKLAEKIASQSTLAVTLAKEAVNAAYETTLSQGLLFEKRLCHATFATKDRLEGMTAFVEKRAPKWTNE